MERKELFVELPPSVYSELCTCIPDLQRTWSAAVYFTARDGIAVHSGFAAFTAGFDRASLQTCASRILGDQLDSAVILDGEEGSARLASLEMALATVAARNQRLDAGCCAAMDEPAVTEHHHPSAASQHPHSTQSLAG